MKTLFTLLGISLSTAMADSPNPKDIVIEDFSYGGSGCPIGSVGSSIAPDGSALSVLFDRFSATTESGAARDLKSCSLDIRMKVPQGWSFALYETQVRGFANIVDKSVGLQRSRYTFGKKKLAVLTKEFRGPFSEDFVSEESTPLASLVYSPCGSQRSLGIQTNLEIKGPSSLLTVDSIDGALAQTYKVSWKRCTGVETIGPKEISLLPSQVRIINSDSGADVAIVQPYAVQADAGLRLAACDLNGDGIADLVTGPSEGLPAHVRVFDGKTSQQINHPQASFFAYPPANAGGVYVGCGDVDGDKREDLITGNGRGNDANVTVYSGRTGQVIRNFSPYPNLKVGTSVASTDLNADGYADIVVGTGRGAGPHVKVFDGRTGKELRGFFAYDPAFRGGVRVAGGDINNDGYGDLITGAGRGGGSHVIVYDGRTHATLYSFFAYDTKFKGGVSVSTADADGDGVNDILIGAGRGGGAHVKAISGLTGLALENWSGSFFGFDAKKRFGVEIAGAPSSKLHNPIQKQFFITAAYGAKSPD